MSSTTIGSTGSRTRYRVPTSSIVVSLVPALLVLVMWLIAGTTWWWYPVVMAAIAAAGVWFRLRQGLVLDDAGVHVTVYRTHHLRWSEVRRFEPGRAGTLVVTDQRSYRSVAPCTGWAAPASAAQVAELEAIRLAHQS